MLVDRHNPPQRSYKSTSTVVGRLGTSVHAGAPSDWCCCAGSRGTLFDAARQHACPEAGCHTNIHTHEPLPVSKWTCVWMLSWGVEQVVSLL